MVTYQFKKRRRIHIKKINIDIDELCQRYLSEDISCLKLGEEYGCCETTIIKRLKSGGNKEVLDKITLNSNAKLTGICDICGRTKKLKRLNGTIFCEAHYKQMKTHGKIISAHILGSKNRYEVRENYIEVKIVGALGEEKGRTFLSLNRLEIVKKYPFNISGNYVALMLNGKRVYLHSFLMQAGENQPIDHINRNPFDNRDENLRFCTPSENVINRGLQKNNTSGVKGVTFDKNRKKWMASLSKNGKTIYLGRFSNIDDAVKARRKAEEKYFGDILFKGEVHDGSFESKL